MNKRNDIIKQIQTIANNQNFEWINNYDKPKKHLIFKCKSTGVIVKTNWSNLKQRGIIPLRNSLEYHQNKLNDICKEYNFTSLSPYVNYLTKIEYKCNKCNKIYQRRLHEIYKCEICNNFYKNNKGINTVTVLRNPYLSYRLYFVYIPQYDAYKIGLYKNKNIKSRYSISIDILNVIELPLYKAYYLEQYIISKYKSYKYIGIKFGGYTEAFNNTVEKEKIIKEMGASIMDVEPCELLENLEVDNQQPS